MSLSPRLAWSIARRELRGGLRGFWVFLACLSLGVAAIAGVGMVRSAIEAAVREYPENTGVLLQAAQINCMALRLKKDLDQTRIERIRTYLTRLEKLLPGHDRVNMMRRYFRETLGALESSATPH